MKKIASIGIYISILSTCLAELAIVVSEEVLVYRNDERVGRMIEGEVIQIKEFRDDPDWYWLMRNDKIFEARRKYFSTATEVKNNHRLERTKLETRLQQIGEIITRNNRRSLSLIASILQIDWDRTVYYQVMDYLEVPNQTVDRSEREASSVYGAPLVNETQLVPRYRRLEKISSVKWRQLMKKWRDELEAISRQSDELIRERAEIAGRLTELDVRHRQVMRKFQRFQRSEETYLRQPYVVVDRYAPLYQGRKRVYELQTDDVAPGRPNFNDLDRIFVRYGYKWFDSPRRSYKSRDELEFELESDMARKKTRVDVLLDNIQLLRDRESILMSYITDLSYAKSLTGEFVALKKDRSQINATFASEYYWLSKPPEATEVIHRIRAAKQLQEWDRELRDLQSEISNVWEEIKLEREQLIRLENRHAELAASFKRIENL